MEDGQRVYTTRVTCQIGFSIQDPASGNWEKSDVSISSEVGPGYPSPKMMHGVIHQQMADAVRGCDEQIETLARRILDKAGDMNAGR
mgnify:CR=1 FL=1